MSEFTYSFEDLNLWRVTTVRGKTMPMDVRAFGEATIRVDRMGEWDVAEVSLNSERDPLPGEVDSYALRHDHPLFALIRDALISDRSDEIEDAGVEAGALDGRNPNREHEFSSVHYGVGRHA